MKGVSLKSWSVLLYIISVITPTCIGVWTFVGFFCLMFGWIGLFSWEWTMGLPWLANIFFYINLVLNRRALKLRMIFSLISISFGLLAIGITRIPLDEGGAYEDVYVGFGFLLWMASFILIFVGQIKEYKKLQTT